MERSNVYTQEIFKKVPFLSLHWISRKYTNALLWADNLEMGLIILLLKTGLKAS